MSYRPPATRVSDARWQPRPGAAPRRRPAPVRRRDGRGLTAAKVAVTVLSLLVLCAAGYYRSQINKLDEGLTRQDVINQPPSEHPADGAIDILLVGMDSRTDAQGHPLSKELLRTLTAGVADGTLNTDTLILIRIPNDGGKAYGISVPRDSYVDIPGYGTHKINSAYVRAKNDAADRLRQQGVTDQAKLEVQSNQDGAKSLIATIERLTGATIDHYAEVNLLGFYDITNAIGGIDVCLNKAVNDSFSGAHFPAGHQNLQGAPALAFVRQRHGLPNGDLDRIVRQQVFMSGMAKKVFSGNMLTPGSDTLDKLTQAIQKSVVLDQNWNVIDFAQRMMNFTGGNLEFRTIPVGSIALKTPTDGDAVQVNPRDVKAFVKGLLGGQPPASAQPSSTGPATTGATVTVDVRNASGRTGLANQVSQTLVSQGFKAGQTGNASTRSTSVVRYATGEQANGDAVAAALGGIPSEPDKTITKGHVTVLLGRNFAASATTPTTTEPAPSTSQPQTTSPNPDGCVN